MMYINVYGTILNKVFKLYQVLIEIQINVKLKMDFLELSVISYFYVFRLNVLKKKLCHKIFEKPRKKQKFDNIFLFKPQTFVQQLFSTNAKATDYKYGRKQIE
jgi:hypothetical protein